MRQYIRSWRCPVYETRNRIVGRAATQRNRVFQDSEVRRLRQELGGRRVVAEILVVIPTYRRPEGVKRAVASALAQTRDDLAVIVVDDGGGLPGDLPVDPRLHAVSLRRNTATLGLVRNVAIHLAESEYIAFLDDDNVWTPDHLNAALCALEADPGLGGVYTTLRRLKPDGSELDVLGLPFDRKLLRWHPYIDANSIVVRRSANIDFSVVPRNRNTLPKEDWEYVWRTSRRSRLSHVPAVTVLYAVNPDSYYTPWELAAEPPGGTS
ncbi:hypothetical protein AWB99_02080 [Mycolicibacterium confluentis]|nr:glycosyltransferase family 2 protein [Mycolicibacterium confluentis]ORV34429.1 hypothetical protein AWB99_02080 [Mycolicibacterium confluentis]